MSISTFQFEMIGAKPYLPDGPFGAGAEFPQPSFRFGEVAAGDGESEFVYLQMNVPVAATYFQGDFFQWDNNYVATPVAQVLATIGNPVGADLGTLFLGMTTNGPLPFGSAGYNPPSMTFAAGTYGAWFQRAGTSLGHVNAVTTQATAAVNGPTVTLCTFATGATHSQVITGLAPCNQKWTFSGTTTTGSTILTACTFGAVEPYSITRGLTLSGTGIPGGTIVTDVGSNTVTMSAAATASAAITVTAVGGVTVGTTTSGSPILTNVQGIPAIYPGQFISGTGIPASTNILSIGGLSPPYQILLNKNATATANSITFTTSSGSPVATNLPNYIEVFLRWPYYSGAAA